MGVSRGYGDPWGVPGVPGMSPGGPWTVLGGPWRVPGKSLGGSEGPWGSLGDPWAADLQLATSATQYII